MVLIRRARLWERLRHAVRFGTRGVAITFALVAIAHARQGAGPAKVNLTGKVIGTSGHHPVYVALWDAQGFLSRPVRQARMQPGLSPEFWFQISSGRWALSAFEDVNGNGVLDMGTFGPKEPSGFWRPFHGWHKPKFDDVAVEVDHDTNDVEIRLGTSPKASPLYSHSATELNDATSITLRGPTLGKRSVELHRLAFLNELESSLAAGISLTVQGLGDGGRAADFAEEQNVDLKDATLVFNAQLVTRMDLARRLGTNAIGLNAANVAGATG